ncbi:hypothetical protein HELRODRAFT_188598 [Helobdella robusta]|uniref:Uncharacterized protein n=1 Tax=Helobdella robusta TaxID=6412 RepID=T1FQ58_HELRO|nr:hypothetical protein HELRODRAFT_188598 [Helobdella robusta]ESO02152.1 hypothetical protein HELRODRAFT_188598 [Helobdella robusta]
MPIGKIILKPSVSTCTTDEKKSILTADLTHSTIITFRTESSKNCAGSIEESNNGCACADQRNVESKHEADSMIDKTIVVVKSDDSNSCEVTDFNLASSEQRVRNHFVNNKNVTFVASKSANVSLDLNTTAIDGTNLKIFSENQIIDESNELNKQQNNMEKQASVKRVQPFEDADVIFNEKNATFRLPRSESAIQEEVRIFSEREESLRKERGFQTQEPLVQSEVVEIILDMLLPNLQSQSSSEKKDVVKKFSEMRLKNELLFEKCKEIDLLNQGRIKSLSEEHDFGQSDNQPNVKNNREELVELFKKELKHVSLERLVGFYKAVDQKSAENCPNEEAPKEIRKIKLLSGYKRENSREMNFETSSLDELLKTDAVNAGASRVSSGSSNLSSEFKKKVSNNENANEKHLLAHQVSQETNQEIQMQPIKQQSQRSDEQSVQKMQIQNLIQRRERQESEPQPQPKFIIRQYEQQFRENPSNLNQQQIKLKQGVQKITTDHFEPSPPQTLQKQLQQQIVQEQSKPPQSHQMEDTQFRSEQARKNAEPGGFIRSSSHDKPEKRIKHEMAEAKKKEEELKEYRRSLINFIAERTKLA